MMNRRSCVAAAMLLVLIGAGGSFAPLGAATAGVNRLVVAQTIAPLCLDVYYDPTTPNFGLTFNINEPLVRMSRDGKTIQLVLAESVTSVDPLTWEIKLRKGIRWHDGAPFTAEDVKFTFDRMVDPNRSLRHAVPAGLYEGATIVSPDVIRLRTKIPYAAFLRRLTVLPIVPKHVVEKVGDELYCRTPVGTGPYAVREWRRGDRVILVANRRYHRGNPEFDEVVFRAIPENNTRVAELLTGNVDIATDIPPELAQRVSQGGTTRLVKVPGLRYMWIGFNARQQPFDNPALRRALSYAINRDQIVRVALSGYGKVSDAPAGPETFGYNPNITRYEYNPDKAKKLLADAGFPNGLEIDLTYPRRFLRDREIVQMVAADLAKVGVKARIQEMESGAWFQRYVRGDLPGIHLYGFATSFLDADQFMTFLYESAAGGHMFRNPELDLLIIDGRKEMDLKKREQIYHKAMSFIAEQAPAVWLFVYVNAYGLARDIQWTPRPDEMIFVDEISRR